MVYDSEIGISELPNQVYKHVTKQGSQFNLMVCGESGLGKSTFINTLFQTNLKPLVGQYPRTPNKNNLNKTTEIEIIRCLLEEKNFSLKVNVIDTPGFGDNVNNNKTWSTIVDFIDDQHDSFMRQEQQPFRNEKFDMRVHAVLYFIKPTAQGLKPLDIVTMKEISSRANLIPVIAKSDTLTKEELKIFKIRIRQVIEAQEISIFTPPLHIEETGSTTEKSGVNPAPQDSVAAAAIEHARQLIDAMPFAVVGSEEQYTVEGNLVYGRKYPWGIVEVENDDHCDFRKLRSLLLRTNLLDLILSTQESHYESFRRVRLGGVNNENTNLKSENGVENKNVSVPIPAPTRKLSHNPKFKEEELALKRYFTDQVKAEEQRFRQWEQNIVNERIRLNSDLEDVQNKVKKLEDQVRNLQLQNA